jgi:uncharacterized protein (DUF1778 family)
MKDAVINVRVSNRDLALLDQAAEIEGKTRSTFLLDCAERAARAVFPVAVGDRCPLCGQITG